MKTNWKLGKTLSMTSISLGFIALAVFGYRKFKDREPKHSKITIMVGREEDIENETTEELD